MMQRSETHVMSSSTANLELPAHLAFTASGSTDKNSPPVVTFPHAPVTRSIEALSFEVITDRRSFDALENDWTDLFERSGRSHQVFQTFNWNWHWCNHFLSANETADRRSLAVLVGRRDTQIVTIWPMVLEKQGLIRSLSWMGEPVSQYGDVLVDSSIADPLAVLREGWLFLLARLSPDVARLRKVRDDATIAPLLAALGSQRTQELEAPYLDLASAPDFATYEQRYAKRSRRNRARLLRRLMEQGPVGFQHYVEGAAATATAALGIRLKRDWLQNRGLLSPALADDRTLAFMAAVAGATSRPAGCRVAVLEVDSAAAAIQINFVCKGRLALHVIVYDLAYEKSGVGVLHIEEQIKNGYAEGYTCFDLLAPKADYKMDWADGTVGVADHALALSAKGRIYARVYLGFLRSKLKAALDSMPPGLRRRFVGIASVSLSI